MQQIVRNIKELAQECGKHLAQLFQKGTDCKHQHGKEQQASQNGQAILMSVILDRQQILKQPVCNATIDVNQIDSEG